MICNCNKCDSGDIEKCNCTDSRLCDNCGGCLNHCHCVMCSNCSGTIYPDEVQKCDICGSDGLGNCCIGDLDHACEA